MEQPSPSVERAGLFTFLSPAVRTRLATGIPVALVAFLAILSTNPWPSLILVSLFGAAATIEVAHILRSPWWAVVPLAAAIVVGLQRASTFFPMPWAAFVVTAIGAGAVVRRASIRRTSRADFLILGWLAGPFAASYWLQQSTPLSQTPFSPNLLILCMVPLWFGDSLGFFVGKMIGKTPLAPMISPKKTWEGAIANAVGCIGASLAIGASLSVPWTSSLLVGISATTIGQLGDLLQSALKRSTDLKDSGWILPGHGGVLDRIDSFLLSAVPSILALWLTAPFLFHVKQ